MKFKRIASVSLAVTLVVTGMSISGIFKTTADTKSGDTDIDIPRVYITAQDITNEYHENNDVTVKIVDQDGGSKGLGCIDNHGQHKDKATTTKYEDIEDNASNIKIRGNTTSTQPKKSWNIKLSKKQSVLGMDKGKKWCLLANSMDKSLMRDFLSYNFGLENGVKYTSQSRYVDVYLNGEYQGNYQMCEPVEAKEGRVEIDAENPDSGDILLELGHRDEEDVYYFQTSDALKFDVNDPDINNSEGNTYKRKVEFAKKCINDFEGLFKNNKQPTLEGLSKLIDVDSFVNFYIANELFKNVDIAFSSTRFYIKDGMIYAGPMWDLDLSSGNCNSSYYRDYYVKGDSTKGFYCTKFLYFKNLMNNSGFAEKVKQRYRELQYKIQSLYRTDSTEVNSIDYLVNRYGESFKRNYNTKSSGGAGWSVNNDDGYSYAGESRWHSWQDPINFLRDWLERRNDWLSTEWGIDKEEAYAEGKAAAEAATEYVEEESTTAGPTTETTAVESTTEESTTVETTIEEDTTVETAIAESTTTPKLTTKSALTTTEIKTAKPTHKYSKIKIKKPGRVKIKKVFKKKKSAKKIRIKIKKVKRAKGYQVKIYKSKKKAKKNKKALVKKFRKYKKKITIKSKKLKNKKKLYVRVRAYVLDGNKKVYGKWSKVKKVKIKK